MLSMFKGADGKISAMRVAQLGTVAVILVVFIAHNIFSMIKGQGFVSLGYQEAVLIATVMGSKAAQAWAEVTGSKKKIESTSDLPTQKTE